MDDNPPCDVRVTLHVPRFQGLLANPQSLGMWTNAVPMELMLSACSYYQTKPLGRRGRRKGDAGCFLAASRPIPVPSSWLVTMEVSVSHWRSSPVMFI